MQIALLPLLFVAPLQEATVLAPDAELQRLATDMQFVEGPVWLPEENALVFSDIPAARLLRWTADGGVRLLRELENPNGNLLDLDGQLLSCRHGARDIVRHLPDGELEQVVQSYRGSRFNSPNDLAIAPDGGLWFTDPPWGLANQREGRELPANHVFHREAESGLVTSVLSDRAMPNGIALSPDARRLYVADTGGHPSHPDPARREGPASVSAYAILAPGLVDPEPLWSAPRRCDGMCVDERGRIYITGEGGLAVLSPRDGSVILEIPVPETPANVCFGGKDLSTLFITARTSLYSIEAASPGWFASREQHDSLRPDQRDRRGDLYLRSGLPELALLDFDAYLEARPQADPFHWRRGIALYEAGRFAEGAAQFERHRSVNGSDVENVAWHYLCVARDQGIEAADERLLPVGRDLRPPMGAIQRLFAGQCDGDEVLREALGTPPERRASALFYGHLYVGLHHEAHGRMARAREHLELAAGEHGVEGYMGDVARVHLALLDG